MINLILAIFWFGIGAALLGSRWLFPDQQGLLPHGAGDSAGWLAVVMGVYNVARWWLRRPNRSRPRSTVEELRQRLHSRRSSREPAGEPDPNFIFTDDPSKNDAESGEGGTGERKRP